MRIAGAVAVAVAETVHQHRRLQRAQRRRVQGQWLFHIERRKGRVFEIVAANGRVGISSVRWYQLV